MTTEREKMFNIGSRKQLFIDQKFIEKQKGITLRMNPPVKAEPALVPETPWEQLGLGSPNVVEKDGEYWMYYNTCFKFDGNRLKLNIDCGAMGEAWVELQDEQGKPIPGFAMAESVSVDRNGVAQEVWWKNGSDVSSLAGKPVCLHIKMRSAKLYAFQFVGKQGTVE